MNDLVAALTSYLQDHPVSLLLLGVVCSPPVSGPRVRSSTQGNGTTVSLPTNETGDVLLAALSVGSGDTPLVSGWNQVGLGRDSGASKLTIWKKVSAGGETSVPVSVSTLNTWTTYAIRAATDVDVSSFTNGGGTGTTVTFPSVSPTTSPTLLIDIADTNTEDGATALTMPAGETLTGQVTSQDGTAIMRTGYKALAASGATGTRTGSVDAISTRNVATVVIK